MEKRTPKRTRLPFPSLTGRRFMSGGLDSMALNCHPTQAREFNEIVKKNGCTGIYYNKKGRCQVTDANDYDRVLKSIGAQDRKPIHEVD